MKTEAAIGRSLLHFSWVPRTQILSPTCRRDHGSQENSESSRIQRDDPCVPHVHVPKVSPPSPQSGLQRRAPAKIRERRKKRREIGQASRGWTMSVARTSLSALCRRSSFLLPSAASCVYFLALSHYLSFPLSRSPYISHRFLSRAPTAAFAAFLFSSFFPPFYFLSLFFFFFLAVSFSFRWLTETTS